MGGGYGFSTSKFFTVSPFLFAGLNESFYMGDLMEGTYCSRIFSNCDKKRCVLQSPNYPGLYPRNLTCYYAIRQHAIPYGHQALISITQPYSRLVSIKTDRTNPENAEPKPVERKVRIRIIWIVTRILIKSRLVAIDYIILI